MTPADDLPALALPPNGMPEFEMPDLTDDPEANMRVMYAAIYAYALEALEAAEARVKELEADNDRIMNTYLHPDRAKSIVEENLALRARLEGKQLLRDLTREIRLLRQDLPSFKFDKQGNLMVSPHD